MVPFEIYVHIPFCKRKCLYCDFLSASCPDEARTAYLKALSNEMRLTARDVLNTSGSGKKDMEPVSLYIGGGTPSLCSPEEIARIIEDAGGPAGESSIEVNPESVTAEKAEGFLAAGINRVSMGVQSFQDDELERLGRIHSSDQAEAAFRILRDAGFSNISLDLMYGIPGQTVSSWEQTLRKAAELSPEHISAYSLIIEEGTPFETRYPDGSTGLPDEDEVLAMEDAAADILSGNGFKQYEISNYARPGYECRHNTGYWTGVPYLGFGAGASSYFEGRRYHNVRDIRQYTERFRDLKSLEGSGLSGIYETERERNVFRDMEEFMFLGLRMICGVSMREFEERYHMPFAEAYGETAAGQLAEGWLKEEDGRIMLTRKGRRLSNRVLAEYLLDEA